ncbi:hypothetical protein EBX93_04360 [bacterium]|nr:hypothetical protein [bacterium]
MRRFLLLQIYGRPNEKKSKKTGFGCRFYRGNGNFVRKISKKSAKILTKIQRYGSFEKRRNKGR